ncbi:BglG family transcription antiterminator, partial [Geobacillus thermocatenulatus]|uniref:BglG family transcription antiterminator n=1 Tax=Geobacillus thermocatenulatus TaxID=33938 RepID=UPI00047384EF
MLTKRQKDILSFLIQNNEPITSEWIAKELGVSDRTVRTELKELQSQCQSLGIYIESLRGKGYKLKIIDSQLFKEAYDSARNEIVDGSKMDFSEQNGRVVYILKRLLLEREPIKLEHLEDELFVSKPTIQSDLKTVREILEKYKLKLVTRPHYGTIVEGEEYMKRLCFSNYILSRNNDLNVDFSSFAVLDQRLFRKIKEIIIKKVNEYKIEISDIALENLATHIAIACKRIKEGFVIENLDPDVTGKHPLEKIVAEEIVKGVEEFTSLTFPRSEIPESVTEVYQKCWETQSCRDFDSISNVHLL